MKFFHITNGFRASGFQHAVEYRHVNGDISPLTAKATRRIGDR
jgi:hypothetical protein